MKVQYMLGCNYWGADHGTDMWRHYDPVRIREEMKQLSEYGVRCMRVFPNWREFQPIEMHYAWRGLPGEYASSLTEMPVLDDGVSQEQLDNFRDFANAAKEYGISLVVAIVTGWMSGRLFTPPALTGKNLINDPEALMWMRRYIHRFVRELKDCDNIIMWDLGNECNCLGEAKTARMRTIGLLLLPTRSDPRIARAPSLRECTDSLQNRAAYGISRIRARLPICSRLIPIPRQQSAATLSLTRDFE